jgi:flagellar hook-basal body complex protein FliE
MTVSALSGVTPVIPSRYLDAASQSSSATSGASSNDFANAITSAIDNVQATQNDAHTLAIQAVSGNLSDIHQATIAAARASVTLELVSAVRNKGVDAFNEIMRMQA